jgi:beta-glucosidase
MSSLFPPGFLFGAATSAHQTEGNNVNSDWWALEHSGVGFIQEPSGDATDGYNRWASDLDLLVDAGLTDYRFSVEWARIEPAPGEFSLAQIGHYRRVVEECRERGLRPMVTLHHFTVPAWFASQGGWASPSSTALFRRYVEALGPVLADGVDHVCTINEPNILAMFMGLGDQPSSLAPLRAAQPDEITTGALISAHHAARLVIKDALPHVQVGWSIGSLNPTSAEGDTDLCAAYAWPRQTVFQEAAFEDDWLGVQAYSRAWIVAGPSGPTVSQPPEDAERTLSGAEYYPPAVGDAVRAAAGVVPDIPIIVTENGIATADDARRIDYTRGALTALLDAMGDGVDVRGYFHWSLLDNYEWGSYAPTFGLVAVDRTTFARTPKPSFWWLGGLASRPESLARADMES